MLNLLFFILTGGPQLEGTLTRTDLPDSEAALDRSDSDKLEVPQLQEGARHAGPPAGPGPTIAIFAQQLHQQSRAQILLYTIISGEIIGNNRL